MDEKECPSTKPHTEVKVCKSPESTSSKAATTAPAATDKTVVVSKLLENGRILRPGNNDKKSLRKMGPVLRKTVKPVKKFQADESVSPHTGENF